MDIDMGKENSPPQADTLKSPKPLKRPFSAHEDDQVDSITSPIKKKCKMATPKPKKSETSSKLVDFGKRGLIFREKRPTFTDHQSTLGELLLFHKYREENKDKQIQTFPEQFYPLLAKLIQCSEYTLTKLATEVKKKLFPDDTQDLLSVKVISDGIISIAYRENYGVGTNSASSIYRWEVNDISLLPFDIFEKITQRREIRQQARQLSQELLDGLSQEYRDEILGQNKKVKKEPLEVNDPTLDITPTSEIKIDLNLGAASRQMKRVKRTAEELEKERKEKQAKKEARELEKKEKEIARESEKAEKEVKKAAKEQERKEKELKKETEKKKKEEAQKKAEQGQMSISAFLMPKKKEAVKEESNEEPTTLSEFVESFPDFAQKESSKIAPLNWFHQNIFRPTFSFGYQYSDQFVAERDSRDQAIDAVLNVALAVDAMDGPGEEQLFFCTG